MSPFVPIAAVLSPWELGVGGACVGGAWWIGGRLTRRPRSTGEPRSWTLFTRDETATAMLDFVLIFPIFTTIVLVFTQLALLINARLVVSYAAFAAARSAVVWLGEDPQEAQKRAEKAAQIGCLSIASGEARAGAGWGHALAVAPLYLHSPSTDRLMQRIRRGGSKMAWSSGATRVRITPFGRDVAAHEPVTVEVEHDFYLSVPYGDRLFRHGTVAGLPVHTIKESFTLTNEGYVQSR